MTITACRSSRTIMLAPGITPGGRWTISTSGPAITTAASRSVSAPATGPGITITPITGTGIRPGITTPGTTRTGMPPSTPTIHTTATRTTIPTGTAVTGITTAGTTEATIIIMTTRTGTRAGMAGTTGTPSPGKTSFHRMTAAGSGRLPGKAPWSRAPLHAGSRSPPATGPMNAA